MSNATTILQPDIKPIQEGFTVVLAEARALKVSDKASHERNLQLQLEMQRAIKVLCKGNGTDWEGLDKPTKQADDLHKWFVKVRRVACSPYEETINYLAQDARNYETEQRRIAEEEQRKLQEEARRKEEERQLAEAIAAEQDGRKEEAVEILEEKREAPVVHVAPAIAEVKGVSRRTTWHAEVTDALALVKYVAEHPEWIHLVEPVMPQLNKLASAQRDLLKIPGVKAVEESSYARRVS